MKRIILNPDNFSWVTIKKNKDYIRNIKPILSDESRPIHLVQCTNKLYGPIYTPVGLPMIQLTHDDYHPNLSNLIASIEMCYKPVDTPVSTEASWSNCLVPSSWTELVSLIPIYSMPTGINEFLRNRLNYDNEMIILSAEVHHIGKDDHEKISSFEDLTDIMFNYNMEYRNILDPILMDYTHQWSFIDDETLFTGKYIYVPLENFRCGYRLKPEQYRMICQISTIQFQTATREWEIDITCPEDVLEACIVIPTIFRAEANLYGNKPVVYQIIIQYQDEFTDTVNITNSIYKETILRQPPNTVFSLFDWILK